MYIEDTRAMHECMDLEFRAARLSWFPILERIVVLKIRGCALRGPLLCGDVISRVLREPELP